MESATVISRYPLQKSVPDARPFEVGLTHLKKWRFPELKNVIFQGGSKWWGLTIYTRETDIRVLAILTPNTHQKKVGKTTSIRSSKYNFLEVG